MGATSKPSPTQGVLPALSGQEGSRNYFCSSAELKDGLEIFELDNSDLSLSVWQALDLI